MGLSTLLTVLQERRERQSRAQARYKKADSESWHRKEGSLASISGKSAGADKMVEVMESRRNETRQPAISIHSFPRPKLSYIRSGQISTRAIRPHITGTMPGVVHAS